MIELAQKKSLSLADIKQVIFMNKELSINETAFLHIRQSYHLLTKLAEQDKTIYGINTGFGALAEQRINKDQQQTLQKNLLLSHAVGVGNPLDFSSARALMLFRLNTLVAGYSGSSPDLIKHLQKLLNSRCAPFVPKKGSVGASGDLAPLAHLGLLLLGIGPAFINNQLSTAKEALLYAGLDVLNLGIRDGLALINGTQAMAASGITSIFASKQLCKWADITSAITLEAIGAHLSPFNEEIHRLKPHKGQIQCAQNILSLLQGSFLRDHIKNPRTQDPYSLRCIPQVHGASKDIVDYVSQILIKEINSVTDNPLLIFKNNHKEPEILSGGNFHGQYLALALDYLAMAVAELANIAERRIELLLNPAHSNGLPPFLVDNTGLNSGHMILHVTASALVNENKSFCHPASIDSIPTSANREDHVSMGMTAANKLKKVIKNTEVVLAIELLAALQALDHRPLKFAAPKIQKIHTLARQHVLFRSKDGLYQDDLNAILSWQKLKETDELINELSFNNNDY